MAPERSSRNCWSLCSTIGNPPFQSAFGSRTVTYQSEIRPLPISHMLYFPSRYMATANTTRRFSNGTALASVATPRPWFSSWYWKVAVHLYSLQFGPRRTVGVGCAEYATWLDDDLGRGLTAHTVGVGS